jgi:class 3 adenylate cyclase
MILRPRCGPTSRPATSPSFTDVEGSTRLLHEVGAEAYARALAEHRRVIREACSANAGVEVDTQRRLLLRLPERSRGIGRRGDAVEQLASGPVQVRVGLHTGTPFLTEEGYVGGDVHRAARIAAAGHGGQVLVSASTASLVEHKLRDLGDHRFKDLSAPERVYQLGESEFLPLKSLYRTNLPIPANPLVGRKRELIDLLRLFADARLVTIVGPGGIGKTRFALAVAGEAAERYPDGVWFVDLTPLRDPALVLPSIAHAVGAETELTRHFADSHTLLLLDNFEQVVPRQATSRRSSLPARSWKCSSRAASRCGSPRNANTRSVRCPRRPRWSSSASGRHTSRPILRSTTPWAQTSASNSTGFHLRSSLPLPV